MSDDDGDDSDIFNGYHRFSTCVYTIAILISHTQCVSFVQREEKIDIVDFILKFAYSE